VDNPFCETGGESHAVVVSGRFGKSEVAVYPGVVLSYPISREEKTGE